MRISLPYLVTVFVLGWLFGCIFLIIILEKKYGKEFDPFISNTINDMKYIVNKYQPTFEISNKHTNGVIENGNNNLIEVEKPIILESNLNNGPNSKINLDENTQNIQNINKNNVNSHKSNSNFMSKIYHGEFGIPKMDFLTYHADKALVLPDNSHQISNENIWIMMDWPVDDRLFTSDNYKCFESILNVYPNAFFRVLLAAPNDAFVHKTGNQLSVNHFVKYKRRGYDIQVLPGKYYHYF